jgi:hypothetical protein
MRYVLRVSFVTRDSCRQTKRILNLLESSQTLQDENDCRVRGTSSTSLSLSRHHQVLMTRTVSARFPWLTNDTTNPWSIALSFSWTKQEESYRVREKVVSFSRRFSVTVIIMQILRIWLLLENTPRKQSNSNNCIVFKFCQAQWWCTTDICFSFES